MNKLKEELLALESDRISGRLKAEEYEKAKSVLEVALKRALKRSSRKKVAGEGVSRSKTME